MASIRLILLTFIFAYSASFAQAKLILSVSKSIDKLRVHQSLLIDQKKTVLLKNSNTFCPENKNLFFIGHFEAKDSKLIDFEELSNSLKDVEFDKKSKNRKSDHTPLFSINNKSVTDPIQVTRFIKPSLSQACELDKWKSIDGLQARVIDKNKLEITFLSTQKMKIIDIPKDCVIQKPRKYCTFEKYGRIYLP